MHEWATRTRMFRAPTVGAGTSATTALPLRMSTCFKRRLGSQISSKETQLLCVPRIGLEIAEDLRNQHPHHRQKSRRQRHYDADDCSLGPGLDLRDNRLVHHLND